MSKFGTELERMLKGKKSLAIFYKYVGEEFDETGGQDFESHVASKQFVKRFFYVPDHSGRKLRYVSYYRPEEAWRFELYKALKNSLNTSGWSKEKELIERLLLENN